MTTIPDTLVDVIARNMEPDPASVPTRTELLYRQYSDLLKSETTDRETPATREDDLQFCIAAANIWEQITAAATEAGYPTWACVAAGGQADSYAREVRDLQRRMSLRPCGHRRDEWFPCCAPTEV